MISALICTHKRPQNLLILLKNISNQSLLPNHIILVGVKNTDFGALVDKEISVLSRKGIKVRKFLSKKGLTLQRNIALENADEKTEIICFLDDDIILGEDYFLRTLSVFKEFPNAVGVAGITHDNLDKTLSRTSLLGVLTLSDSFKPGRLLRSGINTGYRFRSQPYRVEWLSGCTMSYRFQLVRNLKFDTRRVGTSWGEDIDFSHRAGNHGDLYVFTSNNLVHYKSGVNRDKISKISEQNLLSRVFMINDFPKKVTKFWVSYNVLFHYSRRNMSGHLAFQFHKTVNRVAKFLLLCLEVINSEFRKFISKVLDRNNLFSSEMILRRRDLRKLNNYLKNTEHA
jgi:GT2 family glycosyltransferase